MPCGEGMILGVALTSEQAGHVGQELIFNIFAKILIIKSTNTQKAKFQNLQLC